MTKRAQSKLWRLQSWTDDTKRSYLEPEVPLTELPAFNTAPPNKLVNPALTPNGTTIFSTIQAAVNTADPGDIIAVAPGSYYETVLVTRSGTALAPIYIQALDPNNRPVIDGQMIRPNVAMSNGATGRLVSISASHIVWDSIDIVNSINQHMTVMPSAFNNGFFLQPYEINTWYANVKILRSRFEKANSRSFQCINVDGVLLGGCTIIETCRSSDAIWNSTTQNPTDWPSAVGVSGKNVSILETVIAQALGEGIHAGAHISYGTNAFIQVENLVIRNCRVFDTWSSPLYVTAVNGGTIERNVFYNTGDMRFWYGRVAGNGYPPTTVFFASEGGRVGGAGWSTGYIGSVNVTFRNNVIWGGLRLLGFGLEPNQLYNNIVIEHNTMFGAQPGSYSAGSGAIYNGMTNLTNFTLQNNIVYDAGGRIVANDPGFNAVLGTFTKRNNLWSTTPPAVLQGTNDIVNSNVGLTNVNYVPVGPWPAISNFDVESFKILSTSPASSTGIASAVTSDFFGTTRPNPPDIGAHELLPTPPSPSVAIMDTRFVGLTWVEIADFSPNSKDYALSGVDSETGQLFNSTSPQIWGAQWQSPRLQLINNSTQDVPLDTAWTRAFTTDGLQITRTVPYAGVPQCVYRIQPSAPFAQQGMVYVRGKLKLPVGMSGGDGFFLMLSEVKYNYTDRKLQIGLGYDSGANKWYINCSVQGGGAGGASYLWGSGSTPNRICTPTQDAFYTSPSGDISIFSRLGAFADDPTGAAPDFTRWYTYEFAFRLQSPNNVVSGNAPSGWVWAATSVGTFGAPPVNGVGAQRFYIRGSNMFVEPDPGATIIFPFLHYSNMGVTGLPFTWRQVEVYDRWPNDASPHPVDAT